jgi:hypothetical protein
MRQKTKVELVEVVNDLINYIENNIESYVYLCLADQYLKKDIDGGYNKRLLPTFINYLNIQKPTIHKNKDFYKSHYFNKKNNEDDLWWIYPTTKLVEKNRIFLITSINLEKIRFLKHLKNKLMFL